MAAYQKGGRWRKKQIDYGPRRNQYIRASKVRLLDSNGDHLGVMETPKALEIAQSKGLDLVEISPDVTPPICRVIDYAKYKYQQSKKKKQNKSKQKEMKVFRFSPVIEQHDIDTRVKRCLEYLKKGHSVRLTVRRKSRQTEVQARDMMTKVLTYFDGYSTIEGTPGRAGRELYITIQSNG